MVPVKESNLYHPEVTSWPFATGINFHWPSDIYLPISHLPTILSLENSNRANLYVKRLAFISFVSFLIQR